jgi:hypothetical protein
LSRPAGMRIWIGGRGRRGFCGAGRYDAIIRRGFLAGGGTGGLLAMQDLGPAASDPDADLNYVCTHDGKMNPDNEPGTPCLFR